MPHTYFDLLDAVIQYLEELKGRGEHSVQVNPTILAALSTPLARRGRAASTRAQPQQPQPDLKRPTKVEACQPVEPDPGQVLTISQPSAPALTRESNVQAIADLRERVLLCQKCPHLVRSRQSVVFGVGDIHASVMFVGEAPGADEDAQGEPFVGAAGQLLTRIIKAMGFARETVYIANVLKCRPDTPGQSFGNRKPTSDEMKTCLPYLMEQIKLIQPKVIVALGATAMEGLFSKPAAISRARGNWHDLAGTPVMPTFHPSYLLRNQAPTVKRQVWEDMLQVMEKLGEPVSERQRNYFKG